MNEGVSDYDDHEDGELPVMLHREQIVEQIRQSQVTVIISETGSGKTTQIPQFLVDYYLYNDGVVAVTQPRRVAAITVAQRVAAERRGRVGEECGYVVRFDDCTSSRTRIKYVTDGVLVRECLRDPSLSKYAVIMLDEAHERSLSTDILLGLIKAACRLRSEMRVVVTSATMDALKMATYFGPQLCGPVLNIPGRVFPVDIYHSKTKQIMTATGPSSAGYVEAAVETVLKIHGDPNQQEGHILVFLTGSDEIEKACQLIRTHLAGDGSGVGGSGSGAGGGGGTLLVLPLYASLSAEAQQMVFRKPAVLMRSLGVDRDHRGDGRGQRYVRKCIVCTNIAETSITVDNVRFVVDSGYVKQKTYDPNRHMESLVVVPISRVAAQQRAGRAGRTSAGQCYRLYSSDCLQSMMAETIPEIMRSHLGNTVLHLKALGIRDVLGFDFLDAPSESQLLEALIQLYELGAIDASGDITPLGTDMSTLPLEPRVSRMLLAAASSSLHCEKEIAAVAGVLSAEDFWHTPNPRTTNPALIRAAEAIHASMRNPLGDHLTCLRVFERYEDACHQITSDNGTSGIGGNKTKMTMVEWCEKHFMRYRALRNAKNIRDQLLDELKKLKGSQNSNINAPPSSSSSSTTVTTTSGTSAVSNQPLELRVLQAVSTAYFGHAARRSANSDKIFHSVPLPLHNKSDQALAQSQSQLLAVHPSSSLASSFAARDAMTAAWGGGSIFVPEYVVYQEAVQGAGRANIKHVSWVPTEVLKQLRRQYRPLSEQPPYCLSGRIDVQSSTKPMRPESQSSSQEPASLTEEKAADPGLGVTDSVGRKRKACSSSSLEVAPLVATSNTNTTSNNDTNLDSARARYLARQQQQQQQQQQHGNKR